jgi:hypothetical protein
MNETGRIEKFKRVVIFFVQGPFPKKKVFIRQVGCRKGEAITCFSEAVLNFQPGFVPCFFEMPV